MHHNISGVSKKILFLLIFLLLVLVVFFSILFSTQKKDTSYKESIIIDVFDSRANTQGIQTGWFGNLVKNKFNMQLNIIAPNVVGGGDTLYETRVAAENLGDLIICNGSNNNLSQLVDMGLILDMRPYLDSSSSLFSYEAAIRNLNDAVDHEAIYAIPTELSNLSCNVSCESNDTSYGPYLRYDYFAELGYPTIDTLEDLLPVLKAMQDLHPKADNGDKTYGLSFFPEWDNNMMTAAKQPACFYGYEEYGFVLFRADGSDYQDILKKDSIYQRILHFYFTANQMGLVDPDSPTQTYTDVFHKYENGQILYSPWPWLGKSAYNTAEHEARAKGFMLVPINDMKILSFGCKPYGSEDPIIAIGSKTKDPQRLVDFICWLYSPEGIYANGATKDSGAAGLEGLTWENTVNGPVLTEFGQKAFLENDVSVPEQWGGGLWSEGVSALNITTVSLMDNAPNGYPYYYNMWDSYKKLTNTPLSNLWTSKMEASTSIEYLEKNNQLMILPGYETLTPAESEELSTIRSQCKKVIIKYSWDMIFAESEEEFNALYEKMKSTAATLGYSQVIEKDLKNAKKLMDECLSVQ